MTDQNLTLQAMEALMKKQGAERIIFKLLSNNDNSKQQIYLGKDFNVLRLLQHGDLVAGEKTDSKKGVMYKASLDLHWVSCNGKSEQAKGAQLILYPKYPEVRMSGFVKGCSIAPSHLLQPPTKEQRDERINTPRCLMLGLCPDGRILAYIDHWTGSISKEASRLIKTDGTSIVSTIFHERIRPEHDNRSALLTKLREIHQMGFVRSCRLDRAGNRIEYSARNGAGYTLESLLNIIPNGHAGPDYLGWELKSHSSGPVTLMTPEPDAGLYTQDLGVFLENYGRFGEIRRDFTGKHEVNQRNKKTLLTLSMEGYDNDKQEITDTSGGLIMRDDAGNIAAGWSFDKLLTHWSRKHAHTAYVPYTHEDRDIRYYAFGPEAHLCEGADLKRFLNALNNSTIYYDPGINMKLSKGKWTPKKRNQFRISWRNIDRIYDRTIKENLDLDRN